MAMLYAIGFYASKEWEKCRNAFMESKYYMCERCGELAKICHHKKHITQQNINDPNIILSWSNLEALCQECHNREHMSKGICVDGLVFDSNGNLFQTPALKNEN